MNECSCTGYRPILKAFHTFAQASAEHGSCCSADSKQSCKSADSKCDSKSADSKQTKTECKSAKTKVCGSKSDGAQRTGAGHKAGCTGSCGTCKHHGSGCVQDIEDVGTCCVLCGVVMWCGDGLTDVRCGVI
jgi:hypothetical protein